MKDFHFQQFSVKQSEKVFRVGTDGVLLGALCMVEKSRKILEVGSGSGLISMMIAQRNPAAEITAIDINSDAVNLTKINFENSPFSSRLKAFNEDFKNFISAEKFDLIVSNPPFFEENPSSKDILARQQKEIDFQILIKNAAKHLTKDGKLSVIIPFESLEIFEEICIENDLFLQRKVNVFGKPASKAKRVILEFGFEKLMRDEAEFLIEKSPRVYSDQYLELTKEFHIFKKK